MNVDYAWFTRLFGLAIDLWLITGVILVAWALRSGQLLPFGAASSFNSEKFRINLIMTCFCLSYMLHNVWVLADRAMGDGYHFWDVLLGSLLFPCVCNFVPILLVLYAHFKNITSLARILKFTWSRRRHASESSLSQPSGGSSRGDSNSEDAEPSILYLKRLHNVTVYVEELDISDSHSDCVDLLQSLRRRAMSHEASPRSGASTPGEQFELPLLAGSGTKLDSFDGA